MKDIGGKFEIKNKNGTTINLIDAVSLITFVLLATAVHILFSAQHEYNISDSRRP